MNSRIIQIVLKGRAKLLTPIPMTHGKLAVTLLLLTIPLIITVQQTVTAQTYSTQTVTTLTTNNKVNSITIGTTIATSTVPKSQSIFSAPFSLPPTHGVCGIYFVQPFNATAGAVVSGSLTSSSNVDFYLVTDTAYQAWSHQIVAGGICTPASLVISQQGTKSYNFTTPIPTNGLYEIIVNNLSASTVNAQLTANLTTPMLSPVTITLYSTVTQPNTQTLIQTAVQTVQATQGGSMDTMTWILVAVCMAVGLYINYTMKAKRRARSKQN